MQGHIAVMRVHNAVHDGTPHIYYNVTYVINIMVVT